MAYAKSSKYDVFSPYISEFLTAEGLFLMTGFIA